MVGYKEHIESLSKEALITIILGTDEVPPILNRDEPSYNRPQITWALNKINKKRDVSLQYSINDVMDMLDELELMGYENYFNYDFFTFEIRKPSFAVFAVLFLMSILGIFVFFSKVWEIVIFFSSMLFI